MCQYQLVAACLSTKWALRNMLKRGSSSCARRQTEAAVGGEHRTMYSHVRFMNAGRLSSRLKWVPRSTFYFWGLSTQTLNLNVYMEPENILLVRVNTFTPWGPVDFLPLTALLIINGSSQAIELKDKYSSNLFPHAVIWTEESRSHTLWLDAELCVKWRMTHISGAVNDRHLPGYIVHDARKSLGEKNAYLHSLYQQHSLWIILVCLQDQVCQFVDDDIQLTLFLQRLAEVQLWRSGHWCVKSCSWCSGIRL